MGSAVRFRPARLSTAEIPAGLVCRFQCDGAFVGPLEVLDLSTAGFGAASPAHITLAPGSLLEAFELRLGDSTIWTGDAVVVHGSLERLGGRFTSGVLDLHRLRVGATLEGRLALLREQRERLPAEWRAAVADLRQLLEDVRYELEQIEQADMQDPLRQGDEETKLFEELHVRWGSAYVDAVSELHAMSKRLDERAATLGRSYAQTMIMPLFMVSPFQRRAYEKPLGYAGDYRMMELCYTNELHGDGLFGRFLHSLGKTRTLVRAVVAREVVMRDAVRRAAEAEGEGPVRVLVLAAGPAIELRNWLEATTDLRRPVQLILLDQDREAHETAHRHLTRLLLERHRGMLPVTVQCLHFSVRQLLKPRTAEDERIAEGLNNLDLIYSGGLYDYLPEPVAALLTRRIYALLRGRGRLLLGNLMESPDTTWFMDYVLGWPLVYRTDATMLSLAEGLAPTPSPVGISRDATGWCLFLDVTKPDVEPE
jgi:extracellular factor (EF) 3-hydroxypalmitic acid methyl ester biosynthesis protein